jgi:hypothetical protein
MTQRAESRSGSLNVASVHATGTPGRTNLRRDRAAEAATYHWPATCLARCLQISLRC